MKLIEKRGGTHVAAVPIVLFSAMIGAIVVMTIVLWSIWREPRTHLAIKNPGAFTALLPSIIGLTQGSLDAGNQVQLLENGDGFFPLLLRDIRAAKKSVHIESYIWQTGPICDQLAALLSEKAREGVEVRLLVDASGGHKMKKELATMMKSAGVKLARFHEPSIGNLGRLNNRDHRKIMIIDGRIGFIGGYGIAKEWTGHAQDKEHFRDTGLRVEGPTVNRMQGAFSENWIEETGEILAGDAYFPKLPARGTTQAHLAYTSPTGTVSSVQVLYYLAIESAQHEVIIQNPYLLPDKNSFDAIRDATARGVVVKIMVPATSSTDSAIVQHASHHHFGTLLKSGAHVYEYKKTLLHQKLIIVDGIWSCIGSTNFDDRSFNLNDEISLGVLDPPLAQQLRAAFDDDLRFSEERHFEEWSNRPWWHKLEDGLAYLAHGQL